MNRDAMNQVASEDLKEADVAKCNHKWVPMPWGKGWWHVGEGSMSTSKKCIANKGSFTFIYRNFKSYQW